MHAISHARHSPERGAEGSGGGDDDGDGRQVNLFALSAIHRGGVREEEAEAEGDSLIRTGRRRLEPSEMALTASHSARCRAVPLSNFSSGSSVSALTAAAEDAFYFGATDELGEKMTASLCLPARLPVRLPARQNGWVCEHRARSRGERRRRRRSRRGRCKILSKGGGSLTTKSAPSSGVIATGGGEE